MPRRAQVRELLHKRIRDSYLHPQFNTDVMKPLNIEALMDQQARSHPPWLEVLVVCLGESVRAGQRIRRGTAEAAAPCCIRPFPLTPELAQNAGRHRQCITCLLTLLAEMSAPCCHLHLLVFIPARPPDQAAWRRCKT